MKRAFAKELAQKRLDQERPDALVVLDELLTHGTRFDDQLADFVKKAIHDYRLVWTGSRIENPWRIVWQPGRRQEVFCTFCGRLLLAANGPRRGEPSLTRQLHELATLTPARLRERGDRVHTHIRICALEHLGKLRWYVHPVTRHRADEGES